jgi:hypothetical protein
MTAKQQDNFFVKFSLTLKGFILVPSNGVNIKRIYLFRRYSLSEEKLIRQQVEYHQMTVFVSMSPQTIYMSGFDPQGDNMDIPVRCLDCDSISQVGNDF